MKKIEIQNKVIICCDCGDEFVWERGEQLFYEQKGLLPPKRCPDCRRELKRKRHEDERRVREVSRD